MLVPRAFDKDYQNGNFLPGKSRLHPGKKSEKVTLPPLINIPVMPLETNCRWRDRFRSTGEVKKPTVCWKTQGDIDRTSWDVYGVSKLQLFWCDPESIKCPDHSYFTLIFRKQVIKSKLTLQHIWPNNQNYFCVLRFWNKVFFPWWGETFLGEFMFLYQLLSNFQTLR